MTGLSWFLPFFRLTQEPELSDQIRLLLRNCTSPTLTGVLLATLMAISLYDAVPLHEIVLWWTATCSWRLVLTGIALRLLRDRGRFVRPGRTVAAAMAINGVDMVLWGVLAWISLGEVGLVQSVLVIAVLAGVAGNTMSTLLPVLPVFIVALFIEVAVVTAKVWSLGDPAYHALGAAVVLYMGTLMGHARNGHAAVLAAIRLRFENTRLIEQLYAESEHARRAQAQAEQANRDKSRFLAAASHDLRQPIQAQGLFLEVLSDPGIDERQRWRALNNAKTAWQASADMLNTLLDFSRIDAGVLSPQVAAFELQPLLHRIEAEIAPQADAKGLVFRVREATCVVRSDVAMLELIVRNLVSNAVRYTEAGGVLIGVRRARGGVSLEIWDTGVGIAAADHDTIFKEFHQLGNPERDRFKGLGLGLAIARGLASRLGHELSLHSVVGRGSVFRLHLPLADDPVILPVQPLMGPVPLPLPLSVLVVDDDPLMRSGMEQLLSAWGCRCVTAESAEEALAMDWPAPPGLILSDYRLRNHTIGSEVIAVLRAHWAREIPALLLTGDTAKERLLEAVASGIPVLHKPILPSKLYQQMYGVLTTDAARSP